MGEILFRTRLSQSLFRGLSPWRRCCRPVAARQRHRLHDLRRHLRLLGGDHPGGRRISLAELLKRGYPRTSPSAPSRARARSAF